MLLELSPTGTPELTDPKLRQIANRVIREFQLATVKVVAHRAEPASFPMSDDLDSIERILDARFRTIKHAQQQLAVTRLLPRAKATGNTRRRIFGDLASVNLNSTAPIETQVANLPFPSNLTLGAEEIANLSTLSADAGAAGPVAAPALSPINKLELRIHRVKCIDETGIDVNPFGDEFGEDEISLGGTAVDETGDITKIRPFKVGDFDDGDVKTFSPPRTFITFSLREGTVFPKGYFVTLVLAEVDQGGVSDFINKLLEKVQERVSAAIASAIGAQIGASGGPITAAIGAAVGFAVAKVVQFLIAAWSDDIFPPQTAMTEIKSFTHRFANGKTDSPEATATFVGHNGKYTLTYDWRVFV